MPNVRKLAYKDRFVWELIQTIAGGSSVLPPLQFSPAVETPLLVNWTEEQWTRVFSALMTGADLSYPEISHEVVWDLLQFVEYPVAIIQPGMVSTFDIWARLMSNNGGTWVSTDTTFMYFSHVIVSPTPNNVANRQLFTSVYFTPGDYEATILYAKSTVGGISTLTQTVAGSGIVDTIITVDQNGLFNAEFLATGTFTIDEEGERLIVFGNAGGTTSGSYAVLLSSIHIRRIP